jgi:hypothetical protein
MRFHASRKGFCDRAVEIVYQSLLCDLGSMLEARGLDSPHQVEAEVGPVIIRAIKRPHDLEALEYGEDLVVYLEPFMGRFPREIAAMGIEPPVSRTLPLVPSKRLIDMR